MTDLHVQWQYSLEELAHAVGGTPPAASGRIQGVSTDTRHIAPGQGFFALQGEHFDANRFLGEAFDKGAAAVVASAAHEGGPCVVVKDALAALQGFAAFHRERHSIPLFALTGSCGKTMTKDLIAALLGTQYNVVKTQGNLNNEIGCPLSLLRMDATTDIAVIEMGANHAGEIARLCELARPAESAITMVAPAHLEGFGSIENVARAKGEIVAALPPEGTFYVNMDDPRCVRLAEDFVGKKIRYGREGDVVLKACQDDGPGSLLLTIEPVGELRLPLWCRAHISNVLLAIAVGLSHGITAFEAPLCAALRTSTRFKRLRIGPLEIIDDSYNANPASVAAALEALGACPGNGARMAVLGEMLELGETAPELHRQVGMRAGEAGVTHLYARGPHAQEMAAGAREAGVAQVAVYDEHDTIADAICAEAGAEDWLVVKGSRGMAMERVLVLLQDRYEAKTQDSIGN